MKRTLLYMILAAAAFMSLHGCGLYSKYERPDMSYIDSLYRRLEPGEKPASIAVVPWKELFKDTLLVEWIEFGLQHNIDINIAKLRIESAEAYLKAARHAFIPSADFSAKAGISTSGFTYSATPTFAWEADIFGKLGNAKKRQAAALEQSKAYRDAVQSRLIATIASNYYTLLLLDEKLRIHKYTQKTWDENIRTLEALKRAGKTNEAAVLQAKANKLNVDNAILSLEQEIFEAENIFSALVGMVPMKIERGTLLEQAYPGYLSEGVPAELLSMRPDVRQAEMALAQAFYATNEARASFYPSLKLTGGLGFDPSGFVANLAASVLQPIFAQSANKAKLKAAEIQQHEALYEYRQSLLDAGVEVNNAIMMWKTAMRKAEIDRKQIIHLRAAVWNTQLMMKHGLTNYLEVLTAQQHLLQAELNEATDNYQELQGVINLYLALGGGLVEAEVEVVE